MDHSFAAWADEVLRKSVRNGDDKLLFDAVESPATSLVSRRPKTIDPEKLQYIRKLIYYILDGRKVAKLYGYALIATLVVLAVVHWGQRLLDAKRRKGSRSTRSATSIEASTKEEGHEHTQEYTNTDGFPSSSSSSSSSSSLLGPGTTAREDVDIERQPLLAKGGSCRDKKESDRPRISDFVISWLMYQPAPIPLIRRSLPANGVTLFVLGFLAVNIFFTFYRLPLKGEYEFAFADRAGDIFNVNLPLLYLLAAKNQPLKFLTGYSYEALNIFHRRVGELMCFQAVVHFAGMILWNRVFAPEWLRAGDLEQFLTRRLVLHGIGAFLCYELLYFTSLSSFRQRWYEIFLAWHVVLQVAALGFLYLHFRTCRPYVLMCLAIFFADRIIWRLGLKSASIQADLDILEDGKTLMLSADWDIPRDRRWGVRRWFRQSIIGGWNPMDHVFITVPQLGRIHALQAHPFTIASAAPGRGVSADGHSSHAWLNLLIRAQGGFTADLLQHARLNRRVSVRFDGPYGSPDALEMLQACDNAVLIAGGSGIAVVFPLAWALVQGNKSRHGRRIHLLWVVHSRPHRSWMPQDRLNDLASAGVHIIIPEPTAEVGRPDVGAYIDDQAVRARDRDAELGVVVSGPDNMNRAARNACAHAVRQGGNLRLRVEKFGW